VKSEKGGREMKSKRRKWQDDLAGRSDKEINDFFRALSTLRSWELFEKEIVGISQIRAMVSYEQTQRTLNNLLPSFREVEVCNQD